MGILSISLQTRNSSASQKSSSTVPALTAIVLQSQLRSRFTRERTLSLLHNSGRRLLRPLHLRWLTRDERGSARLRSPTADIRCYSRYGREPSTRTGRASASDGDVSDDLQAKAAALRHERDSGRDQSGSLLGAASDLAVLGVTRSISDHLAIRPGLPAVNVHCQLSQCCNDGRRCDRKRVVHATRFAVTIFAAIFQACHVRSSLMFGQAGFRASPIILVWRVAACPALPKAGCSARSAAPMVCVRSTPSSLRAFRHGCRRSGYGH